MIATGFLVLAGAAAGFVGGRWTLRRPPADLVTPATLAEVAAPSGTHDLSPLLAEIREGQQDILRALRERSAEPASATNREPGVPDDRLERIATAVDGIAKRLEEEVALRGRGPGFASHEGFLVKYRLFEKGLESQGTIRADLLAAHRFWSHQDLLDRYGTPIGDDFNPQGTGRTTFDVGPAFVHFDTAKDEVVEVLLVAKD